MRQQIFEVVGPTSGPLAQRVGQELIKLEGVRQVEINVDAANGLSVSILASRLLEAPEFEAAVDAARGQLLVAS